MSLTINSSINLPILAYLADARTMNRFPRLRLRRVLDDVPEDCADLLRAEIARRKLGQDDGALKVLIEARQVLVDLL